MHCPKHVLLLIVLSILHMWKLKHANLRYPVLYICLVVSEDIKPMKSVSSVLYTICNTVYLQRCMHVLFLWHPTVSYISSSQENRKIKVKLFFCGGNGVLSTCFPPLYLGNIIIVYITQVSCRQLGTHKWQFQK